MSLEKRSTTLQRLAVKWRAIGLLVATFARLIRRYEDGCRQGTDEMAAQLEIAARAAHVMLMQELAEAYEDGGPESLEDQCALGHLRNIAVALLAITFVVQNIRARELRPAALWRSSWIPKAGRQSAIRLAMPASTQAILDPG